MMRAQWERREDLDTAHRHRTWALTSPDGFVTAECWRTSRHEAFPWEGRTFLGARSLGDTLDEVRAEVVRGLQGVYERLRPCFSARWEPAPAGKVPS